MNDVAERMRCSSHIYAYPPTCGQSDLRTLRPWISNTTILLRMASPQVRLCVASNDSAGSATVFFSRFRSNSDLVAGRPSQVLHVCPVQNSVEAERVLLIIFNENFTPRPDVHHNAFQGPLVDMHTAFSSTMLGIFLQNNDDSVQGDEILHRSYVYLMWNDRSNDMKTGAWRGNLKSLRARYTSTMTANLRFLLFETIPGKHRTVERQFHKAFKSVRVVGSKELYPRDKIDEFAEYLAGLCDRVTFDPVINADLNTKRRVGGNYSLQAERTELTNHVVSKEVFIRNLLSKDDVVSTYCAAVLRNDDSSATPRSARRTAQLHAKACEAKRLLVELFPRVDPFAVLENPPHTVAAKNTCLHKGLRKYIAKSGKDMVRIFRLFGYNEGKQFESMRSKTQFIQVVLNQGLGITSGVTKFPRDIITIHADALFAMVK